MNKEYADLREQIDWIISRGRGFDLEFSKLILRLTSSHNTFMILALQGDRDAENEVALQLERLEEFTRIKGSR